MIELREKILSAIIDKSSLKQRVFDNTFSVFGELKDALLEMASEIDDALDGKFLKSLPLHHSQRIVCDTDEEFRITLRLRITNDFVMELLSRSRSLTVIRPLHLRERVYKVYQEALKRNRL